MGGTLLLVALAWVLVAGLVLVLAPGLAARSLNRVMEGPPGAVGPDAEALHASLMVADLHCDALLWDRDLNRGASYGHADVPRLAEGRVGLQVFTVVTKVPRRPNIESNAGDSDMITLLALLQAWPPRTWGSLLERALHQSRKLHRAAARSRGRLTVVTTRGQLDDHLERRAAGETVVAGVLGLEGVHALEGDLANVDRLHRAGFRMFGLSHFFDNEAGGSAHGLARSGLTDFGRQVVARMEERGILVDLAHASPALMDDVLALARGPVVVSHGGFEATCDNRRNVADAHVRAIAAGGGVMGIGLWETALCGRTVADWARAVRHGAELVGADHMALGSDWDGAVTTLVDASQTVHLTGALLDEGFTAEEIRKVLGQNVIRVFRETLPVS